MTDQIDEPPGPGVLASSRRLDRVRPRIRRAGLFASGVAAALLAIALYGVLNPGPHQLTQREVSDTVAVHVGPLVSAVNPENDYPLAGHRF